MANENESIVLGTVDGKEIVLNTDAVNAISRSIAINVASYMMCGRAPENIDCCDGDNPWGGIVGYLRKIDIARSGSI